MAAMAMDGDREKEEDAKSCEEGVAFGE